MSDINRYCHNKVILNVCSLLLSRTGKDWTLSYRKRSMPFCSRKFKSGRPSTWKVEASSWMRWWLIITGICPIWNWDNLGHGLLNKWTNIFWWNITRCANRTFIDLLKSQNTFSNELKLIFLSWHLLSCLLCGGRYRMSWINSITLRIKTAVDLNLTCHTKCTVW